MDINELQAQLQKVSEDRDAITMELEKVKAEHVCPEAEFSLNITAANKQIVQAQATFRCAQFSDWEKVVEVAVAFQKKTGWEWKVVPAYAPPEPSRAENIAKESGGQSAAQAVKDAQPKQYDGYTDTEAVKILPQPGGRVTVEFWRSGREYAEEKFNNRPIETVSPIVAGAFSTPLTVANEFTMPCRVFWMNGNEMKNKPGKFYHNIIRVERLQ